MRVDELARMRAVMLPVMAAAVLFLFFDPTYRLTHSALANDFSGAWAPVWLGGQLLVPVVVALLVCYPLARIYGRRAWLAALAVALIASAYSQLRLPGLLAVNLILLCLFVPTFAAIAQRALADEPQLTWSTGNCVPLREPGKLAWSLVPLLAAAFFILHDALRGPAMDLAVSPEPRALMRASLLTTSLAVPAVVAWPIAYVLARFHRRRASSIGLLVVLPTALRFAWYYLHPAPQLPWVKLAHGLELAGLLVFVPLFVVRMQRGLAGARPVLAASAPG